MEPLKGEAAFDAVNLVHLFGRLRLGAKVSEVLRDLVRVAAESAPSAHAFLELHDTSGPVVMISWPGPSVKDPAILYSRPRNNAHELSVQDDLINTVGQERNLTSGSRFIFELPSGLSGTLAILARKGITTLPAVRLLGEAAASLVHSWDSDRRLRDLSDRHRLVSQATQHVIYDWDIPTDTLVWNSRTADVFGHPPSVEREESSWWKDQIHPDDRERALSSLKRVMQDGELFWTCEFRFRRADSSYAWVFERGALVFDSDAKPMRMLGVMEDISRDRELESRLALGSRLAAVGSLASGLAHEINNPLAWVTSNLGFAVEELKKIDAPDRSTTVAALCAEITEALDDAQNGAARIARIVNDLRTFAQADHDRVSTVPIKRVVEGALTLANNELKHRARVVRRLNPAPLVLANESRLGQAIVNLLLNAACAAVGSGKRAEVLVSSSTDNAGRAVIEVSDNGPPLTAELIAHVFDPFASPRPGSEGVGLGLSVTHSIITSYGGTIDVESSAEKGTLFRIVLPPVPEEIPPARAKKVPPELSGETRKLYVVVIDDEPSIIRAIERTLGPLHEIKGYTNGQKALDGFEERTPDVIICDVMMPEMNGPEFWARLESVRPDLLSRVVLLTGGAFTKEAQDFLEQCPAPVVDKPFTPQSLRDAVRRMAPP